MNDYNNAPLPENKISEEKLMKDDLTICPKCSSVVEILAINEDNNTISFRCTKEKEVVTMPIKEYLKQISECKNKTLEDLKDKCQIHKESKERNYVSFCLDCNCHLCKECLKTRIHINHRKINIIEVKPTEEEIDIVDVVIKDYESKLENVKNEQKKKKKEYEEILKEEKRKEKRKLEKENKLNKEKEIEEMEKNNSKYLSDIKEIRKKYKNEIKLRKQRYEEDISNIINKYKLINEKENIKYELKIEKLIIKYRNEINKYEFDKKIENYDKMLRINKVVFNIYNNYNFNYYNSFNINSLLKYYIKSDYINNRIIKTKLGDNYDKIIEKIKVKRIEDEKMKEENERRIKEKERIENEKNKIEEKYRNEINELKKKLSQYYI